jgi:hypothetical protein
LVHRIVKVDTLPEPAEGCNIVDTRCRTRLSTHSGRY